MCGHESRRDQPNQSEWETLRIGPPVRGCSASISAPVIRPLLYQNAILHMDGRSIWLNQAALDCWSL